MYLTKVGGKARWISVAVLLVSAFLAPGQTPQRKLMSGQMPAVVSTLPPLGRLDASTRLRLSISLPLHDLGGLSKLIEQIYDPASPSYRHYLAPDEFDARFGPTEEDYQAVIAWATRSGFAVTSRHPNRKILEVSASVADIERALQVNMRTYTHPTEHRTFFAPDSEPTLDMGVPILNIGGLDNFARPHPMNLKRAPLKVAAKATAHNIGSEPNGNLGGFDYRAAYAPGVSLTGVGQTVGLLEFDAYFPSDILAYEGFTGVSNVPVTPVLLDNFDGTPGQEDGEVALDIEMAISMAPGLSNVVVFEAGPNGMPNDVLDAMSTNQQIKQFSSSWGFGPITPVQRTNMDSYFLQFEAQGQSFFEASDDIGAATNGFAIGAPDDDPYITVVGGTVLGTAGSGTSWLSETVWNAQDGPGFNESGGGVSTIYNIPPWQTGVSITANKGSATKRNVPDVAMVADNVFIVADDGFQETTGGTSCSAPLWAGFTALANQQAAAASLPPIGFINPALYHIGTNSGYTACFDDVTVGNNTNSTSAIHWLAVPGYDLCTGWGSPSGSSLIIALTQPDGFQITPGRGAVASGAPGGPFTFATQTFALTNTGSASLNWALGTTPAWLNAPSTSGTLAANGGGASVSLSLNATANLLPAGVYVADIWFTNLTSGLAQDRQFTLQVGQDLVLDGGFEAGDFCYWVLSGSSAISSIYDDNFIDFTGDPPPSQGGFGTGYSAEEGEDFAALGQVSGLAYISQPLPTRAGQLYLLSCWFENPTGDAPNQFVVEWNTNSTGANILFNQTDLGIIGNTGASGYSNLQFIVRASSNVTTLQFGARNDTDYIVLDGVSVTAIPAPEFQAPKVASGSVELSWIALPGAQYQVQYATDLTQAWTNLGSVITATTSPTTFSDTTSPDKQRFYRLELIAP